MTTETDNAKELRELDAWIAENVTKRGTGHYHCPACDKCVPIEEVTSGCYHRGCPSGGAKLGIGIPRYTTDPAAAFEVLKKCAEKPLVLEIKIWVGRDEMWRVAEYSDEAPYVSAPTLEHAICLFARRLFETTKGGGE